MVIKSQRNLFSKLLRNLNLSSFFSKEKFFLFWKKTNCWKWNKWKNYIVIETLSAPREKTYSHQSLKPQVKFFLCKKNSFSFGKKTRNWVAVAIAERKLHCVGNDWCAKLKSIFSHLIWKPQSKFRFRNRNSFYYGKSKLETWVWYHYGNKRLHCVRNIWCQKTKLTILISYFENTTQVLSMENNIFLFGKLETETGKR